MNIQTQKKSFVKKTKAEECNLYVIVNNKGKIWLDIKKDEETGLIETQILGRRSNLGKDSKSEAIEMIKEKLGVEISQNDLLEKSFKNFSDKLNSVSQKCKIFQVNLTDEQHSAIKKEKRIAFNLDYIKAEFAPGGMPLKQISAGILSQVKLS